jgi:hypothetical protein
MEQPSQPRRGHWLTWEDYDDFLPKKTSSKPPKINGMQPHYVIVDEVNEWPQHGPGENP